MKKLLAGLFLALTALASPSQHTSVCMDTKSPTRS